MKEIPILFSTPMVQAILEGRKTMTRRIVKDIHSESQFLPEFKLSGFTFIEPDQFEKPHNEKIASVITYRYGQPGDVLWVRESFANIDHPELKFRFQADHLNPKSVMWKPSIHMPKVAARIWLMVEDIRVERLQDISEADAEKEGVFPFYCKASDDIKGSPINECNHRAGFYKIWCKINGPESWGLNPWVWVIKFKVLSTTGKK